MQPVSLGQLFGCEGRGIARGRTAGDLVRVLGPRRTGSPPAGPRGLGLGARIATQQEIQAVHLIEAGLNLFPWVMLVEVVLLEDLSWVTAPVRKPLTRLSRLRRDSTTWMRSIFPAAANSRAQYWILANMLMEWPAKRILPAVFRLSTARHTSSSIGVSPNGVEEQQVDAVSARAIQVLVDHLPGAGGIEEGVCPAARLAAELGGNQDALPVGTLGPCPGCFWRCRPVPECCREGRCRRD